MRKDVRGIYVIKDVEDKGPYGDAWELENGDYFYPPSQENCELIKANLSKYKTDFQERITVKLTCNKIELELFPASAIPQKVFFSRRVVTHKEDEDSPYNTSDEYGKLAYELYFKSRKGESLLLTDPIFQKFVRLVLIRSYSFPIELWDALEIITLNDYDAIFAAGVGLNYEELKKTL
jgi:hypothetical protein